MRSLFRPLLIALVALSAGVLAVPPLAARQAARVDAFGRLPLLFEANGGRLDPAVRFTTRGSGYRLFATPQELVMALREPGPGRFALHPDGSVGFEVGPYDPGRALVIDTVLAFGT